MRRVITGHKDGKSIIVDDAEIPAALDNFGCQLIPIWKTESVPSIPLKQTDFNVDMNGANFKPGEVLTDIWIQPPDEKVIKDAKKAGVDLGADWGVHTTDTVDIAFVVSGEIWMELDDGKEVHLKAGDSVVQNGTRHAWINRSNDICVLFAVMIGAKRDG